MFDVADHDALKTVLDTVLLPAFAIDVCDDDFEIVVLNDTHEAVSGMRHDKARGKRISEILSPADAADVHRRYATCVSSGKPVQYSEELSMPNGRIGWLTSLIPIQDKRGEVWRLIGTAASVKFREDGKLEEHLIKDLTYLSALSSFPLYKAIHAVKTRLDKVDISPEDRRFFQAFADLCESSLVSSRRMQSMLMKPDLRLTGLARFLDDGELAQAVELLRETESLEMAQ